jgi:hypothetical protein
MFNVSLASGFRGSGLGSQELAAIMRGNGIRMWGTNRPETVHLSKNWTKGELYRHT